MKVGTLTFHKANNYGAVLQAYALQNHLINSGFDTEIIDFRPNQSTNQSASQKKHSFHSKIMKYLTNPKRQLMSKFKNRKFEKFREKYMKLSSETYYGDNEIFKKAPLYEIFIVGSDQIWNTSLSNNSKAFYLHFVKECVKIAYAGSFGKEKFDLDEVNNIENHLKCFNHISVREEKHQEMLLDMFNIKSNITLDPVFLLTKKDWNKLAKPFWLPKKYILAYVLEYSDELFNHAQSISKELNCELIYISLIPNHIDGNVLQGLGPEEFLYAFANATYICTNSFHGTAFSIIFKKNFTVIKHSTRNSRIDNIIKITGLSDRYYDAKTNKLELINYNNSNNKLQHYIIQSKNYLSQALGNNKKDGIKD